MSTVALVRPVDQVFSQNISPFEAIQQLITRCTPVERLQVASSASLSAGEGFIEMRSDCGKPKIFKKKLSGLGLRMPDITKYEKLFKKFGEKKHLFAPLGPAALVTLSAPRMEPVCQRILDLDEPVDQEYVAALKKELVPAPQKRQRKECERVASKGGGKAKVRIQSEIPCGTLETEPGLAEWVLREFEGRTSFEVFKEYRRLKEGAEKELAPVTPTPAVFVPTEVTDGPVIEQAIAEPVIENEIAIHKAGKSWTRSANANAQPVIEATEPVTETPAATLAYLPVKPNLAPELLDVTPILEPAPKATNRYLQGFEEGQAVVINAVAQKSETMKRFAQGHKLKVVKVHATVEQGQRINLEREDGHPFFSCFANWLEDDFSLEGRIEQKLIDSTNPFDPYSHILQLAKGIKTLISNIAESDSLAIKDKLTTQLKSNENKLKGIAKKEKIWVDANILKTGKLIFVPNGKDFLADHIPATVLTLPGLKARGF